MEIHLRTMAIWDHTMSPPDTSKHTPP